MKFAKWTIALVLTLILGACGGGSSGGDSSSSRSSSAISGAANGIYIGQGNEVGFGSFKILAMVNNGNLYAVSETGVRYSGVLNLQNDGSYSSSLALYDTDNSRFDSASISGTYSAESFLRGDFHRNSGATGDFSLSYEKEAYELPASLNIISGTWRVTNVTASTSVTIDDNGDLFGTDSDGCVFSGNISVPNGNTNIYRVSVGIESCGEVNGSYQGLGVVIPESNNSDMLILMSNSSLGFALDLSK